MTAPFVRIVAEDGNSYPTTAAKLAPVVRGNTGAPVLHAGPRTKGSACAPIAPNSSEIGAATTQPPRPTGETGAPNLSTFSRIARVSGEAFDADQIGWSCDECGHDEYSCECEAETCGKCNRAYDSYGYCSCRSGLAMEDVQAQIARAFGTKNIVTKDADGSSRVGL
jgi:hypothetical protein